MLEKSNLQTNTSFLTNVDPSPYDHQNYGMKNILRTLFFSWWFLAISGIFSVSYFNLQYDAGGNEGLIWWGTFLISALFGIIGEGVGELLPNSMGF